MKQFKKFIFLIIIFLSLSAFTSQPVSERKAQEALPQSHDNLWKTLLKTKISYNEKTGMYSALYPAEVKALVGKEVSITGFILPLESKEKFRHFILAKRTPTCFFCPPGEPNEIIDVTVDKATVWEENLVTITGIFSLTNQKELGMFFKIDKAKLKK